MDFDICMHLNTDQDTEPFISLGISLMLLDVLDQFETIKVCTGYDHGGKIVTDFPASLDFLGECQPVYEELKGWHTPITECRTYEELPEEARNYIEFIEQYTGVPVKIVSVGPDRSQTIVRDEFFRA